MIQSAHIVEFIVIVEGIQISALASFLVTIKTRQYRNVGSPTWTLASR